jgi:hypothetical protein
MSVLNDFQTNAARNDLYRSRLDYLRVQNTMEVSLARALADKEQAVAREEQAVADRERAFADRERALASEARLRERLRAAGIDPDQE